MSIITSPAFSYIPGKAPSLVALVVSGLKVASLVASLVASNLKPPDIALVASSTLYPAFEPSKTIPYAIQGSTAALMLAASLFTLIGIFIGIFTVLDGFSPPSPSCDGNSGVESDDDPPEPGDSSGSDANDTGNNTVSDTSFSGTGDEPPPPPPPGVNTTAGKNPRRHWLIALLLWILRKYLWYKISCLVQDYIWRTFWRFRREIAAFLRKETTVRAVRAVVIPVVEFFSPGATAALVNLETHIVELWPALVELWPALAERWNLIAENWASIRSLWEFLRFFRSFMLEEKTVHIIQYFLDSFFPGIGALFVNPEAVLIQLWPFLSWVFAIRAMLKTPWGELLVGVIKVYTAAGHLDFVARCLIGFARHPIVRIQQTCQLPIPTNCYEGICWLCSVLSLVCRIATYACGTFLFYDLLAWVVSCGVSYFRSQLLLSIYASCGWQGSMMDLAITVYILGLYADRRMRTSAA
ncbi:hypothetical protein DFH07DRAFT_296125 [Mycena maculata]|uniref:Uncharacterized protein n=1 Tax=Mycena maculata TaxID=230809 RepID=A0AAD7HK06_9AGAR|nr:hypothetical protein DFH07DRAFT_296125 [Mycena maculata]